ncbi:MAG: hypothetical protein RIR00_921 [Pseudomonadota bacterium]|jgi:phage tail-like protein
MPDNYAFVPAFFFKVRIGSPGWGTDTSFQEVSGLSLEMETETVNEGGENRFAYRLPKASRFQNLVLSRGVAPRDSVLVRWCRDTLESGLSQPIKTQPIQVSLLNADGQVLHAWSFDNAYPVKWQAETFSSQKNEIAIEKIELAYNQFTRES